MDGVRAPSQPGTGCCSEGSVSPSEATPPVQLNVSLTARKNVSQTLPPSAGGNVPTRSEITTKEVVGVVGVHTTS
ncbi:hypothetical protein PGTUg99_029772 [Puccinia graminis f. sp. tritici]|uniref:Uncharacterized protein n=1 Tax=Puccinia graminis f. sp. tritici TaxID=56615 RepID=A0A5B0QLX4_PUCGR|nr:hypothetical protein PGTUg99_029772 [Puccinia graminis f. sp. tritici]